MSEVSVREVVATPRPGIGRTPVIAVEGLKKHFPVKKGLLRRTAGHVYAVDGVSFSVNEGETLGLVGRAAAANRPSHGRCCASSSRLAARSG